LLRVDFDDSEFPVALSQATVNFSVIGQLGRIFGSQNAFVKLRQPQFVGRRSPIDGSSETVGSTMPRLFISSD
jgi:hypothetical protein